MNLLYVKVSLEDFLESCRAPTLLAELEDDDDGDDALDSDKDNEAAYHEVTALYFFDWFLPSIAENCFVMHDESLPLLS